MNQLLIENDLPTALTIILSLFRQKILAPASQILESDKSLMYRLTKYSLYFAVFKYSKYSVPCILTI